MNPECPGTKGEYHCIAIVARAMLRLVRNPLNETLPVVLEAFRNCERALFHRALTKTTDQITIQTMLNCLKKMRLLSPCRGCRRSHIRERCNRSRAEDTNASPTPSGDCGISRTRRRCLTDAGGQPDSFRRRPPRQPGSLHQQHGRNQGSPWGPRSGTQRLDDDLLGTRAVHDASRIGAVLRWLWSAKRTFCRCSLSASVSQAW